MIEPATLRLKLSCYILKWQKTYLEAKFQDSEDTLLYETLKVSVYKVPLEYQFSFSKHVFLII